MNDNKENTPEAFLSAFSDCIFSLTKSLNRYVESTRSTAQGLIKANESIINLMGNADNLLHGKVGKHYSSVENVYVIGKNGFTRQEIISLMKSLRLQGLTYKGIADDFIQKGIPTFTGQGEWHAQTIHRFVKN